MISKFKKSALLALVVGVLPFSVHAHRNWILPSATVLEDKGAWLTVDASLAEDVFDLERPQKLDELVIYGPDGSKLSPENMFTGKLRSSFDLQLNKVGTYRISIVRESVTASYKLNGETKRFRGEEKDMAKQIPAEAKDIVVTRNYARQDIFATAEKPTNTVLKPTGVGIELEAITHPNELYVGETAKFRLLLDGKPLAGHLFGIIPGGVRYRGVLNEIAVTTDAKGEFSVKWPAGGMYWLNASYPARSAAATPGATPPSRRVSYSATLEVLPQ